MDFIGEHSQRWRTAIVLLIAVLAIGVADNGLLTWLALGTVLYFALQESAALLGAEMKYLLPSALILWILTPLYPHPGDLLFVVLILFAAIGAYRKVDFSHNALALLYPAAGIVFAWQLYSDYGMKSLLWLLVIVALSDVGAYYTGRRLGRRPFSPTSPNKTLEGVAGGVALGTVGGTIMMIGTNNIFLSAILISFAASVAGVFGDLFESYLKREAGVKDSGEILPGHGGVLDRIDGYLFASVVLYTSLRLMGA